MRPTGSRSDPRKPPSRPEPSFSNVHLVLTPSTWRQHLSGSYRTPGPRWHLSPSCCPPCPSTPRPLTSSPQRPHTQPRFDHGVLWPPGQDLLLASPQLLPTTSPLSPPSLEVGKWKPSLWQQWPWAASAGSSWEGPAFPFCWGHGCGTATVAALGGHEARSTRKKG